MDPKVKVEWANNGEPITEGDKTFYRAQVLIEGVEGAQPEVFEAETHKELADKLLNAKGHATLKIRKQQAEIERKPVQATPRATVEPLSADERFQLATDITDPEKMDAAVARIVEATAGVPLKTVGEMTAEEEDEREANKAQQAAIEFTQENPDFIIGNEHNMRLMVSYMTRMDLDPRAKDNYTIAWNDLKAAGLAVVKQQEAASEEAPETTPPAPGLAAPQVVTRPRGVVASSGLTDRDSGGAARTGAAKPKYTAKDIIEMDAATYKYKLQNEAGFAEIVNSL